MSKQIKCLQFNGRSIKKAKLPELKTYIFSTKPDIVLLSETNWKNNYAPKFANYNNCFSNRQTGEGGGVAVLVRKDWPITHIPLAVFPNCEAVGVTLRTQESKQIDIFSVYCPHGDRPIDEFLHHLSSRRNALIVGGDFIGHNPRLSREHQTNAVGRSLSNFLAQHDIVLVTPHGLATRRDPATTKPSTLTIP